MGYLLRRTLRLILNSEHVVYPLAGIFLFGFAVNMLSEVLGRAIGRWPYGTAFLIVVPIIALGISVFLGAWWLTRRDAAPKGEPYARRATARRGVAVLVSRADAARMALRPHVEGARLQRCWLIASLGTQKEAETVQRETQEKVPQTHCEIRIINDVLDPVEYHTCLTTIFDSLGDDWEPNDLITDITGMHALGSVGATLACIAANRPVQYTTATVVNGTHVSQWPVEIGLQQWQPRAVLPEPVMASGSDVALPAPEPR